MNNPLVLIIIDGWGIAPSWGGNAISLAKTPTINRLWREYPHTTLKASGADVGLPGHERGNSETGHFNIGAGHIVHMDAQRINKTIEDKTFFKNDVLLSVINHVKKNKSKLHLLGILSEGGVHAHINHLYALIELAKQHNLENVYIHGITDGRDAPSTSGIGYIQKLDYQIKIINSPARVATIMGRFYAMDRDQRWKRMEQAYKALAWGIGINASSAFEAISNSYKQAITDEFIVPTIITKDGSPLATIDDNDGVIFSNFRGDRAWEICAAFLNTDFNEFKTKKYSNLKFASFSNYRPERVTINFAFHPEIVEYPLAKILSVSGLKQLHVAESEKYAHVTYFINGGIEKPFIDEDRKLIPSLKVKSYDQTPQMAAPKIAEEVAKAILENNYDVIFVNFANPDMVGHTGNLGATIKACEAVDAAIAKIISTNEQKGITIITADHGNAENMIIPQTGEPDSEHTINPAPFILISQDHKGQILKSSGKLANITPTILDILGIERLPDMEESLLM